MVGGKDPRSRASAARTVLLPQDHSGPRAGPRAKVTRSDGCNAWRRVYRAMRATLGL